MGRINEREFRLRPRKPRRPKGQGQPGYAWSTAFRTIMRHARSSKCGSSGSPFRPPKRFSQRCSVRVSFTRNVSKGQWRAHGRYLSRDSALKPGAAAELGFDAQHNDIDIPSKLNEWQTQEDERLWRLIVSPEFGERMDLVKLTRDLLGRVERDIDKPLEWVAVAHFNTEHPHVHVALRGRDGVDKEVRFERDYVRNGMRAIAEDACTRQIGFRTTLDAEYAQSRETGQHHVTSLDRIISRQSAELSDDPARFLFALPELTAGRKQAAIQSLAVRANVLVRMGLAEPVDARTWSVRRDFEPVLRSMKRGRDRQKTLRDHGVAISDDRLPFVTGDLRRLKMLQGRVLVHGEDESGRSYLLIEGIDAQVHHTPYTPEIQDARHRGQIRANSFVRLRRLFVNGRPVLEIEDLGDAEALLKRRSHFVEEVRRHGALPDSPNVWGGWLGRYHKLLATASAESARDDRRSIGKQSAGRDR